MKKVISEVSFDFAVDGSITVELGPKGTVVSDNIAAVIIKRFPFVTSEAVDVKEAVKEIVKEEKVEAPKKVASKKDDKNNK